MVVSGTRGAYTSPERILRFIYELQFNAGLPWVYGGEYIELYRLVQHVVKSWIKVGCRVYFVFDGPYPELKINTTSQRINQSVVQPSLLFFRTSPSSRSTWRFQNESRILPPLSYTSTVSALQNLQQETNDLQIHFADEEGDPFAVELAGRVGGFVVGNDSDFVVLNHQGYRGYVPLGEIFWSSVVPLTDSSNFGEDADFQPVRRSKSKKRPSEAALVGNGIVPPHEQSELTLKFSSYSPDSLAKLLSLPSSLLPLIGALVGNDYSNYNVSAKMRLQKLFFECNSNLSQRIRRVSDTIRDILYGRSTKRKIKQPESVVDLIDQTVNALLSRTSIAIASGEIEQVVNHVVESTLKYAIGEPPPDPSLWQTNVCPLHKPLNCGLVPMISRNVEAYSNDDDDTLIPHEAVRELYLKAYRDGNLSPRILDLLHTGTFWPRLFLENPDLESVCRSIGGSIRLWIYSIVEDSLGLPDSAVRSPTPPEEESEASDENVHDDDEIVDVVESDSEGSGSEDDPLAPLKGALKDLHSGNGKSAPSDPQLPRVLFVTEYVRKGSRVAIEDVPVHELQIALDDIGFKPPNGPLLTLNDEDRRTLFLKILHSDVPAFSAVPREDRLLVLSIRWVLHVLHSRFVDTDSKERQKERWTFGETKAVVASFFGATSAVEKPDTLNRNIQIVAQLSAAMESISLLSQVLMISDFIPSCAHRFSGKSCHAMLVGATTVDNVPSHLVSACLDGQEDALGDEPQKRKKTKANSERLRAPTSSAAAVSKAGAQLGGTGLYKYLADAQA